MIDKTYRPEEVEPRRYQQWEAEGAFAAHEDSSAKPYTIMMPPPNVTGSLHIGHVVWFQASPMTRFECRIADRTAVGIMPWVRSVSAIQD